MLEADLDTIVELGCNVIRIAEFSWHLMEKKEGEYDFSFFNNVIEKAKERGLKVILGTLTATILHGLQKSIRILFQNLKVERKEHFTADMFIVSTAKKCMNTPKK